MNLSIFSTIPVLFLLSLIADSLSPRELGCQQGDAHDCFMAGIVRESETGVPGDKIPFFKRSCDLGHGPACKILAVCYRNGSDGVAQNYQEAVRYNHLAALMFSKSCKKGNQEHCIEAGLMYIEGTGIPQNCEGGLSLLLDACGQQTAQACNKLGEFYEESKKHGCLTQDIPKALYYFRLACKYSKPYIDVGVWSCVHLGHIYEHGILGVAANPVEAVRFYNDACQRGQGCDALEKLCSRGYPGCP